MSCRSSSPRRCQRNEETWLWEFNKEIVPIHWKIFPPPLNRLCTLGGIGGGEEISLKQRRGRGVGENTVNSRVVGLKLGRPKKRGGGYLPKRH